MSVAGAGRGSAGQAPGAGSGDGRGPEPALGKSGPGDGEVGNTRFPAGGESGFGGRSGDRDARGVARGGGTEANFGNGIANRDTPLSQGDAPRDGDIPAQRSARLPADDRVRKQRDRILHAAQQCFIEHGFHAASMASIAATAKMSAGLIYRYFESKSAIMQAIIARQLDDSRGNIASLRRDPDLGRRVRDLFAGWRTRDPAVPNAALLLEMSAHATRDPLIAAALLQADRITGGEFIEWLRERARQAGQSPTEQELRARAMAFKAFIDGLAVRSVREPESDPAVVRTAVDMMLELVTFG